ncbi:hypothetical protein LCGC14_2647800 [marine sediment metagenome]|uniref:Phage terminase small subunit P27 family n=1 Tax=marine sediment metagenome TaxID=412755 RepID=A0A0F9C666_9ZZZZ
MGKRGPAKLPTALKIERGTYRSDRDNPDQPEPDGPPEMPVYLEKRDLITKRAREIWDWRVAELGPLGIVCRRESEMFAMYCMELATYEYWNRKAVTSRNDVDRAVVYRRLAKAAFEDATRLGAKFGLTASDRTGVKAKQPSTGGSDRRKRFFGGDGNEKTGS